MFGLGVGELLLIFGLLLLIFGAKRLPQMGKGLGEGIRNFKSSISSGAQDEENERRLSGDRDDSQ